MACTVLCYYALHAVRGKDVAAAIRVLPVLTECDVDIVYQDMMLHSLVSGLAGVAEHFGSSDLQDAINKFFMVSQLLDIRYSTHSFFLFFTYMCKHSYFVQCHFVILVATCFLVEIFKGMESLGTRHMCQHLHFLQQGAKCVKCHICDLRICQFFIHLLLLLQTTRVACL